MKGKIVKDHLGVEYSSESAMCKAYGISVKTYRKRRLCNWDLEEALTCTPVLKKKKPMIDHHGVEYASESELCRAYGIKIITLSRRLQAGMSLQEALEIPVKEVSIKVLDHTGKEYSSETEMCNAYEISRSTYRKRKMRNMSTEEALRKTEDSHVYKDHLGNVYPSLDGMLVRWGIKKQVYSWRIKQHWTLEEALTTPVKHYAPIEITDHNGRTFKSIKAICRYYNVDVATFKQRINNHWSIQEALTGNHVREKKIKDHLGNKFSSIHEMCQHYNLTISTYNHRIERGMSLEEALTYEAPHVTDHMGNEFSSTQDMCIHWKQPRSRFDERIAAGWSLQEALTIPQHASLGEKRVKRILDELGVVYFHNKTIYKVMSILELSGKYDLFVDMYIAIMKGNGIEISKARINKLKFDFSIVNSNGNLSFIEFDGEQHFQYIFFFFRTMSFFIERCETDQVKQRFAEIGRIPLLRIRYDQTDLAIMKSMIVDFLNNPDQYVNRHNTYLTEQEYWDSFAADVKTAEVSFA